MNENVLYYLKKGQYEEAIDLHEEDLEEFGYADGDGKYFFLLAGAYQELGNYSKAIESYLKVIEYYSNSENEFHNLVYLNLVILEARFRHREAVYNYLIKIRTDELLYPKDTYKGKLAQVAVNECYYALEKLSTGNKVNFDDKIGSLIYLKSKFYETLVDLPMKSFMEAEVNLQEVIEKINKSGRNLPIRNTFLKLFFRLYREWYQYVQDNEVTDFFVQHRKNLLNELMASYYPETVNQPVEGLEEIKQFWAASLNIEPFDEELFLSFIGRYNLIWIINAFNLASQRNIENFGRYSATILKKWAETGFPGAGIPPKLPEKMATEHQLRYVKDLLFKNNLALEKFCEKKKLSELSMQDANKIITAITKKA